MPSWTLWKGFFQHSGAPCRVLGLALLAFIGAGGGDLSAQASGAVTGEVRIGLAEGTVAGDVCLHGLPAGDSLTVVLNRSLGIEGTTGARWAPELSDEEPGGDAIRHILVRSEADAPAAASDSVCVRYSGRETVYDVRVANYREEDSSRVIAFNGTTVRARGSARWYPSLFDPAIGLAAEAAPYRIRVECEACEWIYMNGARPLPGPVATFESAGARELFLLAGDFPVTDVAGTMLLGKSVAPEAATRFLDWLTRIRQFEEAFMGVPFDEGVVVALVDAVREPRRGLIWGFYSDPTLTLTGMTIPEFVEILDGRPGSSRRSIVGFLAHEMAHEYFGWGLGWESSQRDLFGEPFATYLELKAVRHFVGEDAYRNALAELVGRASRSEAETRLDRATALDFSRDSYRYGHAPALIFALEAIIGETRARSLLRALVTAPLEERARADLSFIRRTALSVGVTAGEWREWEERCVLAPPGDAARCFAGVTTRPRESGQRIAPLPRSGQRGR